VINHKSTKLTVMKLCPVCQEQFPLDVSICPADQIILMEPDPLIGTKLNQEFLLEAFLGQGGMGVVYRARQLALDRTVAIKLLKASSDASALKRFQREAIILSGLDHPNLGKVYSCGITQYGQFFIAFEYLRGRNLGQIVESDALDRESRRQLLRQIAAGLQCIHGAGVLHRDIKPANVLVCSNPMGNPVAKIIDFGLAWRDLQTDEQRLTKAGEVVGTVHFMSPEQLRGEEPNQQWDIFAFGRLAEYVLAVSDSCKDPWDSLIERCVELDKRARYQTMTDVIAHMDLLIDTKHSKGAPGKLAKPIRDTRKTPSPASFIMIGSTVTLAVTIGLFSDDTVVGRFLYSGLNLVHSHEHSDSVERTTAIGSITDALRVLRRKNAQHIVASLNLADALKQPSDIARLALAEEELTRAELCQANYIAASRTFHSATKHYHDVIIDLMVHCKYEKADWLVHRLFRLGQQFARTAQTKSRSGDDLNYRCIALDYYSNVPHWMPIDIAILQESIGPDLGRAIRDHDTMTEFKAKMARISKRLIHDNQKSVANDIINKAIAMCEASPACTPEDVSALRALLPQTGRREKP
jgi:serine/threonine protein kinase